MDSNDYQLRVNVIFGNKNFKMESVNIISLEQIKNLSLEKFGLKKEEKKLLSFTYQNHKNKRYFIQNHKNKRYFIESENDLIKYAEEKDSALEINIYLNIDNNKNEVTINNKIDKYNSEEVQSNLNKEYEKEIEELKEEIKKQKNQKNKKL